MSTTIAPSTNGLTGIINPTGSSGQTGSTSQTGSTMPSPQALQDEFLKLLTSQLQHQDPTSPMDTSQFTSQLAQFSQLEQLSNLNTSMGDLSNNMMASNLIGKYVTTSAGDTAQVTAVTLQNNQASLVLSDNSTVSMSNITKITNTQ